MSFSNFKFVHCSSHKELGKFGENIENLENLEEQVNKLVAKDANANYCIGRSVWPAVKNKTPKY
uniref:Uncharacterized protein n=1 Tax=Romanomermis culicivorax TaxID=13658 RepID=A0A915L6S3_ROMCU